MKFKQLMLTLSPLLPPCGGLKYQPLKIIYILNDKNAKRML